MSQMQIREVWGARKGEKPSECLPTSSEVPLGGLSLYKLGEEEEGPEFSSILGYVPFKFRKCTWKCGMKITIQKAHGFVLPSNWNEKVIQLHGELWHAMGKGPSILIQSPSWWLLYYFAWVSWWDTISISILWHFLSQKVCVNCPLKVCTGLYFY